MMMEQFLTFHEFIDILIVDDATLHKDVFRSPQGKTKARLGTWNFYVPSLKVKLPYVHCGLIDCRHPKAPNRKKLFQNHYSNKDLQPYSVTDWKKALSKTVRRRTVENYIAASRLHAAGLGPEPLGIYIVRRFRSSIWQRPCENVGLIIENILSLPPKAEATEAEIINCGVTIDKIRSCIRQQINGYVSDLNSVCGVMPVAAENEIKTLLELLNTKAPAAGSHG